MRKQRTIELAEQIHDLARGQGRVQFMEICGTHTVSLFRTGVRSLLPANVELISGPGCPVCVTSQGYIDAACALATRDNVTICTYGDMLRVPGRAGSLEEQRAQGADIRVVYSIRDAVRFAAEHTDRNVVFLAVGFETTAPATAAAVVEAERNGLANFYVLLGHKLVMPAMCRLLESNDNDLAGFLCPGHVSVVIGTRAYEPIVTRYHKPCVVAGFEPEQMLLGILRLLEQVVRGEARLDNVYSVAVADDGNPAAIALMDDVFVPEVTAWRAMGEIPGSGLALREGYRRFDARERFDVVIGPDYDAPGCRCGEVIQGKLLPAECVLFKNGCSPSRPIGPCMVSSEGTCAAWFKYGGRDARAQQRASRALVEIGPQ